jgi:hypothetical protein
LIGRDARSRLRLLSVCWRKDVGPPEIQAAHPLTLDDSPVTDLPAIVLSPPLRAWPHRSAVSLPKEFLGSVELPSLLIFPDLVLFSRQGEHYNKSVKISE